MHLPVRSFCSVMRLFHTLLLTIALWAFSFAHAEEPAVPAGFSSLELKDIKTTLFKPDGWHVLHLKRTKPEGPLGYQITLEDIEKLGGFKTGLTINVFDKVEEHHGVKPSVFAAELSKRYAAKGEIESFKDGIETGDLKVSRLRLRRMMKLLGQETETMLVFTTMANDKTGTCFLFIFGTPVAEWAANEKLLIQMSRVDVDEER